MSKMIYCYHPDTGEFAGTREANLSPLDLAQGREVYLIPKYSTEIAPPTKQAGYILKWTGSQWEQIKLDLITKTVAKKFYKLWLEQELKVAFPTINIVIAGDVEAATARTLVFHNLPDTEENQAKLDAVLAAHVLPGTKIEHLGNNQLIAFQVLCEEMQKINASFPDFTTFSQLVNAKLDTNN